MNKNIIIAFEENSKKMENLMIECGFSCRKELINYALSLYEYKLNVEKEGFEFGAYNPKNNTFKGVHILNSPLK